MIAIEFENISKQYRLGLVSTGTLPGHSRETLQQLSRSSQKQYRHRKILK